MYSMSKTRVVNGRIYTVTEIPQEDVDEVKKREGFSEQVGKRLLMNSHSTVSAIGGRTAPKHATEMQ